MFVTRHLADCKFSMVEEAAIPHTGYLPQVRHTHVSLIISLDNERGKIGGLLELFVSSLELKILIRNNFTSF